MRLLRAYPAAWRARYGDELVALLDELDGAARMSSRVRLDVVRAGIAERARTLAAAGAAPPERARRGSVLVLYAWMLFVLGGFGVQKASEHWQAATPSGDRTLPAVGFDALVVTAAVGSALVVLGVVVALPRLVRLLRGGGWSSVRLPILVATGLSLLTVAATGGLAAWAHSLRPVARNGGDAVYAGVFGGWVLLVAVCLFAWAYAASATARRIPFSVRQLRLEAGLAAATSAAMVVMTLAAAVWWGAVASAAPWFFDGLPVGSSGGPLAANVIVPVALMVCATALGLAGASRALRALPALADDVS